MHEILTAIHIFSRLSNVRTGLMHANTIRRLGEWEIKDGDQLPEVDMK